MLVKAIKCNNCGDIIYSRSVHDFHWCSCEKCAIDGGFDYYRIIGNKEDWEMTEVHILDDKSDDEVKKILYDDWNYRKNKYGTIKENADKNI